MSKSKVIEGIDTGKEYRLTSGRRVIVLDVVEGIVTYEAEGLPAFKPYELPVPEFLHMVGEAPSPSAE